MAAGFLPFIFAPLWNKAQLVTDNQFVLLRFSGKGATILHVFRAFYVGIIICSVLVGIMIISFKQIITSFFIISDEKAILIISILVVLFALKASLKQQFYSDFFHAILYFLALILLVITVFNHSGNSIHPENVKSIFPTNESNIQWQVIGVYILVQWWSVNVLDGSGAEAPRFMNINKPIHVFKVAAIPIIFTLLVQWISVFSALKASAILGSNYTGNGENILLELAKTTMPNWMLWLFVLGLFAAFISTVDGFLNWGASFVTIDLVKTYFLPQINESKLVKIGFGIMVTIAIMASVFAYYYENLQNAIKFLFAIGAGVGPVFLLRWFWMRINAFSQLSAMLASFIFSVLFDIFETSLPLEILLKHGFDIYSIKIIVCTLLVSITWLLATFLTSSDDENTITNYQQTIKPYNAISFKNIAMAITFGLGVLVLNSIVLYLLSK